MIGRGGWSYKWRKTFLRKWDDDVEDGINRIYIGDGTEDSLDRAKILPRG